MLNHTIPIRYIYKKIKARAGASNPRSSMAPGGDTGFLIRKPFTQLPTTLPVFSSFELSYLTLKLPQSKVSFFNIYRPPASSSFSKSFSVPYFLMYLIPSFPLLPPHPGAPEPRGRLPPLPLLYGGAQGQRNALSYKMIHNCICIKTV